MDLADAADFARTTRQSVLTTVRPNGRPQLSNVLHHVFDDGIIRISLTADRAKYRNLSREPWATLHVTRDDFFAYVVLEGEVELTPVAAQPDDPTVDELVAITRRWSVSMRTGTPTARRWWSNVARSPGSGPTERTACSSYRRRAVPDGVTERAVANAPAVQYRVWPRACTR